MSQGQGPIKFEIKKITSEACHYTLRVTAEVNPNYEGAKDIYFYFKLDTTLFSFDSSNPLLDPPVNNLYTWYIGNLNKNDPPALLELHLTYLDTVAKNDVCPFTEASYSYLLPDERRKFHDIKETCEPFDVTPCSEPPGTPLTFSLSVAPQGNCKYVLHLEVLANKNLTNLKVFFTLNTDLFNLVSFIPSAEVTPGSPDGYIWTVGAIPATTLKALDITLTYKSGLPAAVVAAFVNNALNYTVEYDGSTHNGSASVPALPVAACTLCCDGCTGALPYTPVPFDPCVSVQTTDVNVVYKPEGLLLFVNLTVDGVCINKDLVVLVLVYGITYDDAGNPVETLKTHRIVTLPALSQVPTECTTRTCEGMIFALPETLCNIKDFRVKAIAHYYNDVPIPLCTCTQ